MRHSRKKVERKDRQRIKQVTTLNSRNKGVKHMMTPNSRSRKRKGILTS